MKNIHMRSEVLTVRQYTQVELNAILLEHKKWIETDGKEGKRADLSYMDLEYLDLSHAELQGVDLSGVVLKGADLQHTDFSYAKMQGADLSGADAQCAKFNYANMSNANLSRANLCYTEMKYADMSNANLNGANLRYVDLKLTNLNNADLDYSAFPLWVGSLDVHVDDKFTIQLLYRVIRNAQFSKNTSQKIKRILSNPELIELANEFHRVDECGRIQIENKKIMF